MVCDGVNDAASIAAADLGFAMGSGTDVAKTAADVTLVRDSLTSVPQAIRLSRATLRVVKQNLAWAFGYNAAAVPLAAFGLAGPMLAGAAMAVSSVAVVLNALRLARFERGGSSRGLRRPGDARAGGAAGGRLVPGSSPPGLPPDRRLRRRGRPDPK
jgi:cation transport ATPase